MFGLLKNEAILERDKNEAILERDKNEVILERDKNNRETQISIAKHLLDDLQKTSLTGKFPVKPLTGKFPVNTDFPGDRFPVKRLTGNFPVKRFSGRLNREQKVNRESWNERLNREMPC